MAELIAALLSWMASFFLVLAMLANNRDETRSTVLYLITAVCLIKVFATELKERR